MLQKQEYIWKIEFMKWFGNALPLRKHQQLEMLPFAEKEPKSSTQHELSFLPDNSVTSQKPGREQRSCLLNALGQTRILGALYHRRIHALLRARGRSHRTAPAPQRSY